MKHLSFILLAAIALVGCYDCGPQKELTLRLHLNIDSTRLHKVYARNNTGYVDLTSPLYRVDSSYSCCGRELLLPISLHEDQTTYFFEFGNRKDSLTVIYKRKFYYDDHCGFVVDVETEQSPPRATGTFSYIEVISQPYVGGKQEPGGFFGGGYYLGGIYIRATP